MTPYVTRIAPSPTGMMHIGTARTALFNWLAAKASGGRFILRIDDTDVERNNEAAVQPIIDGLSWLGLDYDETFRQSDKARQASYREIGESLLNAGEATRASNGAIILSWNAANARSWRDNIGGEITITDTNVEQIHERTVLTRGDDKLGAPTYQFSSIVDDCLSGVNYIIRGTDHITNTSKQLAIKWAIERVYGKEYPMEFAHVGLIFKDKKKMSKRDGAASLLDYKSRGYNPDALFNFLLRMGWGPKEDNKANSVMERKRAIEAFLTEGKMRNVNANFDEQKLNWYQRVFSRG